VLAVVAVTLIVTGLAWAGIAAGVFAGFQRRATDALFPSAGTDRHVAVVLIDRKALQEVDRVWPWTRVEQAALTNKLVDLGARVITFDIVYAAPKEGDEALAAALKRAPAAVLAAEFSAKQSRGDQPDHIVGHASVPTRSLLDAAGAFGHAQVNADPNDGVVRSLPVVLDDRADNLFVPALALETVMALRGITSPVVVRPDGVQMGNRFVPTSAHKTMLINFSARLSDPTRAISAADVMAGRVARDRVAGKAVFVGVGDPTLGDNKAAPTNKAGIPGVMLHANAANTLLTATYLEPVSRTENLLVIALLAAAIAIAVLTLPVWLSPIIAILAGLIFFVVAFLRFDDGHVMNLVYPLLTVVLAFVGSLAVRYFAETRQRRRVTSLFAQYVPEAVAQRLVDEDRAETAVEGQRVDLTVLFCDLRGFTAMSESLEPSVLRALLNHYYDRLTELILAENGTLMKYVGDEVMGIWGAPIPTDEHAQRALACAIAIQRLVPTLNRELTEMGTPTIACGIGLQSGEAVAAHFGGGRRRQYDVVGDTINVGARLCGAAGRGEILVTSAVLDRIPDPPNAEELPPIELKGVSRDLRLYRIVISDEQSDAGLREDATVR